MQDAVGALLDGPLRGDVRLRRLRRVACEDTIPTAYRHIVWKLFLGVGKLCSATYLELAARDASCAHEAIRNDAGRTFRSDACFRQAVGPDEIARVLDALRYLNHEDKSAQFTGANRCPVCATLLYAMPSELEAFWTLQALATRHSPTYFANDLNGAVAGAALVSQCISFVDGELAAVLQDGPHFEQCCAYPLLASFFACAKPLAEVLQLWDVVFAVGIHFLVVLCVALCVSLRSQVLRGGNDAGGLALLQPRNLPPLNASKLKTIALDLAPTIPEPLYKLLIAHPRTRIHRDHILDCAAQCAAASNRGPAGGVMPQ